MSEIPKILEVPSIGYIPGKGWVKIDVDGSETPIESPLYEGKPSMDRLLEEILGKPLMDRLKDVETATRKKEMKGLKDQL